MTTISIDARTFRLRVPVLWLGRVRGSLVVHVTEQVELRLERRHRRLLPARTASTRTSVDAAIERADAYRTAALAHRLPTL